MQINTEAKPYDSINVTPMLDLAYVLLVVFILMTTAGVQGLTMTLPKPSNKPSTEQHEVKIVQVMESGALMVNGVGVTLDQLEGQLNAARARDPKFSVMIRGEARARLGDLEDLGFGLVEQRLGVLARGAQRARGDLVTDRHQLAQDRTLADDLRVTPDVGRRRRVVGELGDVGEAAGLLRLAVLLQRLEHGDGIRRPPLVDQLGDVAIDATVVVAIKVRLVHQVGDALPGLVVEQDATDQRLLGLQRMRRQLDLGELRVGGEIGETGRRGAHRMHHRGRAAYCSEPNKGTLAKRRRRRAALETKRAANGSPFRDARKAAITARPPPRQ